MFLLVTLVGCAEEAPIHLLGTVYQSSEPLSAPLGGAELELVTFDGAPIGTTTADDVGAFDIFVPPGQPLFVIITADGYATSVFPGSIGLADEQFVEDHALFGVSTAERQEWVDLFAGCPGVEDGAFVVGEVREFEIVDPYSDVHPTASTAQVTVRDADQASWEGCYLDDEGLAHDPEAAFTGGTGRFLVPGVPEGIHDLVVEVLVGPDTWTQNTYPVRIPARDDVVSPWWPLWASFPI